MRGATLYPGLSGSLSLACENSVGRVASPSAVRADVAFFARWMLRGRAVLCQLAFSAFCNALSAWGVCWLLSGLFKPSSLLQHQVASVLLALKSCCLPVVVRLG